MPTFSSLIPGFSKAEMSAYLTSDCFDKALLNRRVRLVEVADRREIKKEAAFLHHQIAVKVPHMALVLPHMALLLYLTWLSCFTSHGSPALPHMALVLYLTWFSCFTSHGSRALPHMVLVLMRVLCLVGNAERGRGAQKEMELETMACMAGARDRVDRHRLEPRGKRLSTRQETVERSFSDAKQLHGHRYARMRGRY
jgi:hypothetical protein